ncbi:plasmid pRiA4b ORF-3 family protein [Halanaerobium sp. Z-7514]|uniref:Plasmid pRiA4b ORF-3 family protein n=1 Tax=Halanaerobium polyolivorans TaxID=2886943 RepID=A0AAW4X0M3_9FIRM|nr:plasmid pRiA4b ORF-3 family protein [Halanaerobium polyolivorans]MCC3145347.1 plasmid pRiA4b ORF-3 family protein [Halanaerobium polyolivorans]RQD69405.1 MAG: plasmid pRiA4b ORF-3 family protein [Halanaerobium sp. MSAO_Bac5]
MLIQVTKKLRDELKIKNLVEAETSKDQLFCWHANIIRIERRKVIVMTNNAARYTVVLYGLKKNDFKNIAELIKSAIRETFTVEGVKEKIIESYLNEFEEIEFSKTKSHSQVARMNHSCKEAQFFHDEYIQDKKVQSYISRKLSHRIVTEKDSDDYYTPGERLNEKLEEYYGESPVKINGAVIKVDLELGEYSAWRKVIVPLNYYFYDLHKVIQNLYNWMDYHLHEFFVYSEEKDESKSWNQAEYHRDAYKAAYNIVMNEENLEYNKHELNYEGEDFELSLEKDSLLKDYLPARIKYIYDYGDNWELYLEVEEIIEDYNKYQSEFLEGAGTAPPEDVGGVPGFSRFMEIISDPEHEEHEMMSEWAKSQGFEEYDPEQIKRNLRIHL